MLILIVRIIPSHTFLSFAFHHRVFLLWMMTLSVMMMIIGLGIPEEFWKQANSNPVEERIIKTVVEESRKEYALIFGLKKEGKY